MGKAAGRKLEYRSAERAALEALGQSLEKKVGSETYGMLLIESLLKIRDKRGHLVSLRANAAQRQFEARCAEKNIVLKARQMGISTWVAARFFLHTILRPGTLTVQVAHTREAAEELFRMVHRFVENLPVDLQRGALRRSRANQRQLVFPAMDSEYRVESAGDINAGRGLTIQNLHCSEVARWGRRADEVLSSLRAAVPPGGEIVLESTANGVGGCFYTAWQRAEERGYVRHFFPWWMDAGYRLASTSVGALTAEEQKLVASYGLDEAQIAFRRQAQRDFGKRATEEFAEEAETCFAASGEMVFEAEVVERRLGELFAPIESRENGRVLIWLPAVRGRRYILGVDPAGGGADGDYACIEIIDRESGLQCAELYGHYAPNELARRVAALGREYNQALAAVERNNHGHAVLAMLEQVEKYEPLFRSKHLSGWVTNAATRPAMLERFGAVLRSAPELFQSRRLLGECRSFIRRQDGRIAAAEGAHDDAVMAMALALAVREPPTAA